MGNDNTVIAFKQKSVPPKHQPPQLGLALPFLEKDDHKTIVTDSIAVWDNDDAKTISGILLYQLRTDGWFVIYCHTTMLEGRTSIPDVDGTPLIYDDYYDIPPIQFEDQFANYIDLMIDACDQKLMDNKIMESEQAQQLYDTILELADARPNDFTFDIYVPPMLCPKTGELYIRPGNTDFNNPQRDIIIPPVSGFKRTLHRVITNDVVENGLSLSCDSKLYEITSFDRQLKKLKEKYDKGAKHTPSPVHRQRRHAQSSQLRYSS